MKTVRKFEEFVNEGVVKTKNPDLSRANFLILESEKSYSFVKKLVVELSINDENANSIIRFCYDIILELVRAKMLKKGFSATGEGAHEAEVAYLRILNFSENEIQFINQLRYFRNSITYYGKILDKEYAEKVFAFLNKIYPRLKKL